jgi:hypothetical protein
MRDARCVPTATDTVMYFGALAIYRLATAAIGLSVCLYYSGLLWTTLDFVQSRYFARATDHPFTTVCQG